MPFGIKVQPWAEAVAKISAKTPLGSALRSYQWDEQELAIREAAFFSARVESARLLSDMQRSIVDALSGNRTPGGAINDRGRFISDMRKVAQQLGVGQLGKSEITNMQGPARLGLIYDMQTRQARGFARWKTGQDADMMNEWPAQRLIRISSRKEPRDWEERWDQAAMAAGFVGVAKTGMVALKDSPIWRHLSRFGTPWPPFDYGSGMGVEDVDRGEAERLGLVLPGQIVQPTGEREFSDRMEASAARISPEMIEQLKEAGFEMQGNKLVFLAKLQREIARASGRVQVQSSPPPPTIEEVRASEEWREIQQQKRAESDMAAHQQAAKAAQAEAAKALAIEEEQRQLMADTGINGAKTFGKTLAPTSDAVGGSTGAVVMADQSGQKWVVKTYGGNTLQSQNEYIANQLYAKAGVKVPEMRLVEVNGQIGVASKMITGVKPVGISGLDQAAGAQAVQKGFAADAWLANWDVAGLEGDNLLRAGKSKTFYRVDQGGALLFRARGTPKGELFGPTVPELETLRNMAKNATSARAFAKLTDEAIAKQIRTLASKVKPSDISTIIAKSGLTTSPAEAKHLASTLAARLAYMKKWAKASKAPQGVQLPHGAIPNLARSRAQLAAQVQESWRTLDGDARKAVEEFTGSAYHRINKQARESGIGNHNIDRSLDGRLPRYDGVTGRGMNIDSSNKLWRDFEKFTTGEWAHAEKKAYTSTAVRHGGGFGGNLKEFYINKGGRAGGYIGPKSLHPSEDEYLLGRNWIGRVVGWGESPGGKQRFLVYEEILPWENVPKSQPPPKKMTYEEAMELWKKSSERK